VRCLTRDWERARFEREGPVATSNADA
jgi:hypothetical protein